MKMKNKAIKSGHLLNLISVLFMLTFTSMSYAITESVVYFHNDLTGSALAASNDRGDVIWKQQYEPFGKQVGNGGKTNEDAWYTSKPLDKLTGLTYINARYLDTEAGRWLSTDPMTFLTGGDMYFNRYMYAANSPYNFVDKNGAELSLMNDQALADANVTHQFNLTMDLIDQHNQFTQQQEQLYAENIIAGIENSFTVEGTSSSGFSVNSQINIDLSYGDSGDSTRHQFFLVGDNELGGALGRAFLPDSPESIRLPYNHVLINADIFAPDGSSSFDGVVLGRTAAHELGHTVNLQHPHHNTDHLFLSGLTFENFMSQTGVTRNADMTPDQIFFIEHYINSPQAQSFRPAPLLP